MQALIDLFWSKHAELLNAIDRGDTASMARLDRELDPLLKAIFESQASDPASIQAQFQFALDLLNEEADDGGCVRRNGYLLQTLVERYVSPEIQQSGRRREQSEADTGSAISDVTVDGVLDDALLNRISDRVMVIAPGYRVFYSNETNASRHDLPREALIGRHIAELVGIHRFRQEFKENLDRCFAGESAAFTYADQVNGQTVVIHCRMSPCFSGSSQLIGALVVMQETADRRRRSSAA